jgi:hypothetical protein
MIAAWRAGQAITFHHVAEVLDLGSTIIRRRMRLWRDKWIAATNLCVLGVFARENRPTIGNPQPVSAFVILRYLL